MKDFDLSDLELSNIGNWPIAIKGALVVVLCVLLLVLGYFLDTQTQLEDLERAESKEVTLKKDFQEKQKKANNLDVLKEQKKQMEVSFGTMLKQLPSKTEIENLLDEITQTGLASGIEFELFKPETERFVEFYAQKPVKIRMKGSYHQFGSFTSGVAALPRIVTLHNISIGKGKGQGTVLSMDVEARTYRYLDDEEITAQTAKEKKAKGKRRR